MVISHLRIFTLFGFSRTQPEDKTTYNMKHGILLLALISISLQENLAPGGSIQFATLVIASWCYYSDKQTDLNGNPLDISDALKEELHEVAEATDYDPLAFIKQRALFGDLIKNGQFFTTYHVMLEQLHKDQDIKKLMQDLL